MNPHRLGFKRRLAILIIVLALPIVAQALLGYALSSGTPPGRTLYISTLVPGREQLSFTRPTQATTGTNGTLPLQFLLPPIVDSGGSIAGGAPLLFSLWLSSNTTSNTRITLQPVFRVSDPRLGFNATLGANDVILNNTVSQHNLIFTMPSFGMLLYYQYPTYLQLSYQTTTPLPVRVTIYSAQLGTPSSITVPFANYASIMNGSVKITDFRGAQNQTFNIQAPPTQNIVFFSAVVRDIFGSTTTTSTVIGDIAYVNLTISGPQGPVKSETNVTMNLFCPQQQCEQPSQYQVFWVYPSNTPIGTYSASIDIVDQQGNVIHDTTGVHSFGIGPIPPPFPLVAVVTGGGVVLFAGAATSVVYLRRRRTREYLAPFSYFERMTGGEVPGGSMVTVEGNTGAGKTTLCSEIMYEDLKRGRPCLYVAADDFPDRIREQMRSLGIDVAAYESIGLLTFVDCYSAEAGRKPTEKFSVGSMGDLTTLGVKISSALENQKGSCLYLDSLSPFVPRTKPESIVSFVHAIGAKVRGIDGKAFFTLSTGSDAGIQRQLEDMADCVIQMEAFEENDVRRRRLRVRKFRNRSHQEGWSTFTIESGKGIIFYTRNSRRAD